MWRYLFVSWFIAVNIQQHLRLQGASWLIWVQFSYARRNVYM